MPIQTVKLSTLKPPSSNPRSGMDKDKIKGLAASIKKDGVLQNLVVKPIEGNGTGYRIIAGERRYRALALLKKTGDIANDYDVPVEIRTDLTEDQATRIATVENTQRESLPPMDEARAFKKLVRDGVTLDQIAAETGHSAKTITRRLALNLLCPEAQEALSEGKILLTQAEALSIGKQEDQQRLLPNVTGGGYNSSPDRIRDALTRDKPCVALAIFPLEQYTGSFTKELFADDESTFFDDVEQFMLLQEAAVNVLAASHSAKAPWVEITNDYSLPEWLYEEAPKGQKGGVVINLSPDGDVEVKEGLLKTKADEETVKEVAKPAAAPEKKKQATYAKSLCAYIAHHKTVAVQSMLIADPRKAKEIAVLQLIGSKDLDRRIKWQPHSALSTFAKAMDKPPAYEAIEKEAAELGRKIGKIKDGAKTSDRPAWKMLTDYRSDDPALYKAIKALSDKDLDRLLVLLTVMPFGQLYCDELDTGNSVFNAVAHDLKTAMRDHWTPDRAFLEKRNTAQLQTIARDSGFADGRSLIGGYKKGELVTGLERHFHEAQIATTPKPSQRKALTWLPEAMQFPAINPDARKTEKKRKTPKTT